MSSNNNMKPQDHPTEIDGIDAGIDLTATSSLSMRTTGGGANISTGSMTRTDGTRSIRSTRVDKEMINAPRPRNPLETTTGAKRIREMNLKDMAGVVRTSVTMSHITPQQLERVRAMHDRFAEGSKFSFNYNTLLVVAGMLAGLGLVSNSSTTIIASMLVSPIMGPVTGMAYGATIHDWKLVKMALKTETLSLVICVVMGLLLAACTGWTDLGSQWPTPEMVVRGTWQNFFVALPVAFFSGLGVAVSLLDEQTSSLVGVAISASLLPPAVNAGILWIAYWFYKKEFLAKVDVTEDTDQAFETPVRLSKIHDAFRKGGLVSLSLTLANVIIIIFSSMLMFRLKERLPIKKKVFWEDLGVARKIYQNRAWIIEEDDDEDDVKGPSDGNIPGSAAIDQSTARDDSVSMPEVKPTMIEEGDEEEGREEDE